MYYYVTISIPTVIIATASNQSHPCWMTLNTTSCYCVLVILTGTFHIVTSGLRFNLRVFRLGTSIGGFFGCVMRDVCVMLPKESYRVEYSTLQTSTEARLAPLVEYKELSMCTLSVQNCSAWP
jgi:hypothetical protein